ncbi:Tm-1-like ATP-binding domain-containing protein [Streptomyces sp. VRA16 Mangrove soil]|uniref:Tm-1-like ATP-binding domain-containing protein n=1 Tax=Streptomyces sp. VRA16 Mangrove soil TaxID=2817434 RepID=UPI001A9CF180|nr:Tm-1-like ATP-binding domain-containing protein [Streptomyces sp. VRA16 Mangrove soil]MBO1331063.1 Tm-1-like ATP-binding domain-containing protein [Streptomyces sp. VRA16 Mangrove soil]
MATVALVGTLDTKGAEYAWLRDRLREHGCEVVLVDVGVLAPPGGAPDADVPADIVARAAGHDLAALRAAGDRGAAVAAMAEGAAEVIGEMHRTGVLHAVLAAAGSGGSAIAAQAMRALPIGVPKVLVSTMAGGDVAPYVDSSDLTLMYSVVDIAGINSVSRRVLGNAVAAVAGMAAEHEKAGADGDGRKVVAATMFGVTTPAVEAARARLTELGYEVLVFHATGAGGRAVEKLAADGMLDGVLDLTTTELADELVGGVLSAGPDRLTAAGAAGVPQVVAPGALDMVNFGPEATVPARFANRRLLVHNPTVTLMRTTPDEMRTLGEELGRKIAESAGPAEIFWPLRGVSAVDIADGPFEDATADAAALAAVRGTGVRLHELDAHINDPAFAVAMADRLHTLITTTEESGASR